LPIEQLATPEPFVNAVHDVDPTVMVTDPPAGIGSPLPDVTLAENDTELSLPTAALDALSETVV
jgi:hypothetical protein